MKIKFNASVTCGTWQGYGGFWRPGEIKEVPDDVGHRLLDLYHSPFTKMDGDEKAASAKADKMIHGAPENKSELPIGLAEEETADDAGEAAAKEETTQAKEDKPKGRGFFGKRGRG